MGNLNENNQSQTNNSEIKPWNVIQAIQGSNGALSEIALRIGVSRTELRHFLEANPKILELVEDEREASVERIMQQQYNEAMDGNMQARESYIKMVSGYFSKKDEKKENTEDKIKVNIVMPEIPSGKHKAIDPETNQLVEVDDDFNVIDDKQN